ncbi:MAG: NAD(P)(+) transhydrogenase (Re/Si-specific) subunit beta [Gammaproteobacteria bacterium]|nr:MAG: NAD(P)(+) transhydrogenase (Re/Si-specific) subunit beta [Gammaproteobacteria bacterium]
MLNTIVQFSFFLSAVLFIIGLKQMASPKKAQKGIVWAGVGMLIATLASFLVPNLQNLSLILIALVSGSALAYVSAKKVAMTDMPQMIALYNGMGGGAAAAIAAVELINPIAEHSLIFTTIALSGAMIGSVAFSGSIIAFAKLQGWQKKQVSLPAQNSLNAILLIATIVLAYKLVQIPDATIILTIFFVCALVLGIMLTLPIGGADMPVVISLYNALTGLAVGLEGFVLQNPAMMIAGIVVGASGTLLTQLMAKAMNRSLFNVLFSNFGATKSSDNNQDGKEMKAIEASDAAVNMAYANQVIIVPGYGMAAAAAQHKIWELTQLLQQEGVTVKFAIHPVAGRMPGHMNVLLAEAGVPYELIYDLEQINAEFSNTDVSLIIGANDTVNPAAENDKDSPIYGMPILKAQNSQNVIVIKRGKGTGFSGVQNELFVADNTKMLFGDGQKAVADLINAIKSL